MATPRRRCPQCGAEVAGEANASRPFCSARCQMIDLGNWLGEHYRIPGEALPEAGADDERSED